MRLAPAGAGILSDVSSASASDTRLTTFKFLSLEGAVEDLMMMMRVTNPLCVSCGKHEEGGFCQAIHLGKTSLRISESSPSLNPGPCVFFSA